MVSESSDSTSKLKKAHGEQVSEPFGTLSYKIHQLKKQIQVERVASVKEKIEKNGRKLESHVSHVLVKNVLSVEDNGSGNILSSRIRTPLCKYGGFAQGSGDKDYANGQKVLFSTSTKLPYTDKIPPYTTWIFLDRNQRMAEDQSVVGRRRIYYDQHGSEALICSDSEEEIVEPEQEKHEFSEGEDRILWMVFQEHGLSEEVVSIVSQFIGGTTSEIQERYNTLKVKYGEKHDQQGSGDMAYEKSRLLDKSLSAALDSFDNLFCRRCLVFDCRLHGCSQSLINPIEKQSSWSEHERAGKPCSDQCYLQLTIKELPEGVCSSEAAGKALNLDVSKTKVSYYENMGKRKVLKDTNTMLLDSALNSDDIQYSVSKKQKKLSALDVASVSCKDISVLDCMSSAGDKTRDVTEVPEEQQSSNTVQGYVGLLGGSGWKPIEEELYLKGIEIFGKNSCLIARNLLSGLKTCMEVYSYMHDGGAAMLHRSVLSNSFVDDNEKAVTVHTEQEMPIRSRLFRRRGRTRKLKYSWKSSGHPSVWKRIAHGKNQSCKQYTPCGCKSMCGKECPCLQNGTTCEKYCGCSKSCKNRFRGCHCAKSRCRSRQCPCFAARRECDPDVCRNCWVSCGDGTLGEPPRRGESQCGNMRLLLRQQQKILLSKSDVVGWGAFIKNPVNKDEYLGEYTGEIISHGEAEKRGKIYDRANSSFLFDLNDQYCLDAYRKGDKLKFANHSSTPNCYAKVILVAGDHRVGIFAKDHIDASEELFYDYCYGPDQAPPWAKKPEGSNREDSTVSQGRAKKHQSHS